MIFEYGVKSVANLVFAALLHFQDFVYYGFERLASFCVAAKPELAGLK